MGLVNFVGSQKPSQRAAIWEAMFLPKDPRAILEPVWKLPKEQLESVLQTIEDEDWNAACKIYESRRRDEKSNWARIVGGGLNYGKAVAAQWRPDNWVLELEGASEQDLMADITNANDALRALGASQAVEQSQIDRGIEARDEIIPKLQAKANDKKAEIAKITEHLNEEKSRAWLNASITMIWWRSTPLWCEANP